MALNNVKELTVPVNGTDKAVKMIQDSNGNIIWGSQSAFPYRRLEYIEGDGVNYVETNTTPNRAAVYDFEMAYTSSSLGNALNGSETANAGSTNARFKFGRAGAGGLYMGFATSLTTSQPTVNEFYKFHAGPGSQYIKNAAGTTLVSGTATLPTSGLNTSYITLFGIKVDTTVNYIDRNIGTRIKSYTCTYQGNTANFIPVQRKSDNKCGFYNTLNNTFYAEIGSGALIAGPVVDEYWDLTA